MTRKVELFSGKVLTVPPTDVSANRYKWLKLAEAEPNFGVPTVDGAFIYSTTTGERNWTTALTTDIDGNLYTNKVSIVDNKITATGPTDNLELGTANNATNVVRVMSKLLVEGDLEVNGNFQANVQISEIAIADGGALKIGNDTVLTQTTLGPTVVNSSLTSVATVTSGVWHGTVIETEYGGTGIGGVGVGVPANSILYGRGVNPMGQATGSAYQVLQLDASGVPVFSGLDGGGY